MPISLEADTIYEQGSNMNVKDLSVEEFKLLIQEAVEEKLEEILGNPDSRLELREKVKERFSRSLAAMQGGEEGVAIEQVARMLRRGKGNEWSW